MAITFGYLALAAMNTENGLLSNRLKLLRNRLKAFLFNEH